MFSMMSSRSVASAVLASLVKVIPPLKSFMDFVAFLTSSITGFDGEYIPTTHRVSAAKFRQCVLEARMRVLKGRTVMIRDAFTA
jgi:hypothetical protein